jgi:hypothetical protein
MAESGRQALLKSEVLVVNWRFPFESAFSVVYGEPKTLNENGIGIADMQSSQLEPVTKAVPGTSATPRSRSFP